MCLVVPMLTTAGDSSEANFATDSGPLAGTDTGTARLSAAAAASALMNANRIFSTLAPCHPQKKATPPIAQAVQPHEKLRPAIAHRPRTLLDLSGNRRATIGRRTTTPPTPRWGR